MRRMGKRETQCSFARGASRVQVHAGVPLAPVRER